MFDINIMSLNKIIGLCLVLVVFCSSNEYNLRVFDVPQGSNCTWNDLEGTCTNIMNCRSARESLSQEIRPPICSFHGKIPIVCCTDCELLENSTTHSDLKLDSRFNQTGSKARDHCLNYMENLYYPCNFTHKVRVERRRQGDKKCYDYVETTRLEETDINNSDRFSSPPERVNVTIPPPVSLGIDARRNQYPHMALLGYGGDIDSAQWLCGGSVISEKYILTAAHCISSFDVGPVKYVALGILKRSDPTGLWQKYNVKRIIAHPDYHPPSKYNDIALLETDTEITFGFRVLPACLSLAPESDETAEATGWGALGHRQELADTLQTVKLHRYDAEKCSQLYPKHRLLREGYDHNSQMCYGDTVEAKDTCEGDSGGPLQTANVFLPCAYTVLGVTSYGRQCGVSAGSGMYTRVYHYVPWIESIVWP